MKEHLFRTRLAAGALHDLDLAFLHEVTVLHDVIERFDLERRIQQTVPLRRIKRDAMVQAIDPQICDVANPVADLGAEFFPELKVPRHISRSDADAMKLGNAGVTAGEIAAAALRRARDQIDAVARTIPGQQGGLNVAKPAIICCRAAYSEATFSQPLFDFNKRRLVPRFDP